MISGFVLAKPGEKISKSKNNATQSPLTLIKTHSADAIRYWAANNKLGTDTFFSEEEMKVSKRFLTKLYNAAKFTTLQLGDYEEKEELNPKTLLPIDRWLLERVNETTGVVEKLLNEFEIGEARHEIDELFWKDFCDYYIEIAKERLYQPEKHGIRERDSGQFALYHGFLGILKLYAVYTPFITEYIYQEFYRKYEKEQSIHQMVWDKKEADKSYLEFGEEVKGVIGTVRREKDRKADVYER